MLKTFESDVSEKLDDIEYLSRGYYEEKRSKFYSYVFYINTEEEATTIIEYVNKKYIDARHVTYAYALQSIYRYCDDGEPSGTAGKMIYSLLEKKNVTNILIIVIRYFGGVLLGAGNLSRAYLKSAKDSVDKCSIVDYIEKETIELNFAYDEENIVRDSIRRYNANIINTKYSSNIQYIINIDTDKKHFFEKWNNVY